MSDVAGFDREAEEARNLRALRRFFIDARGSWEWRLSRVDQNADRLGKRFLSRQEEELAAVLLLMSANSIKASIGVEMGRAREAIRRAGLNPERVRAAILENSIRTAENASRQLARQIIAETSNRLRDLDSQERENPDLRRERIDRLFGRTRSERIAITSTSGWKSTGTMSAREVLRDEGIRVRQIWKTYPGACEICVPLDGKDRRVWGRRFPDGPPAHPSCRCDLINEYD